MDDLERLFSPQPGDRLRLRDREIAIDEMTLDEWRRAVIANSKVRCVGGLHACLPESAACGCGKHIYPARAAMRP